MVPSVARWAFLSIFVLGLSVTFASCAGPVRTHAEVEAGAVATSSSPLELATTAADMTTSTITNQPSPTPKPPTATALDPAESSAQPPEELLATRIDQLIEGEPGVFSVVVVGLDGRTIYRHEPDLQIEAASLYKLGIMVETYRLLDAGTLAFDELVYMDPAFFAEDLESMFEPGEYYSVGVLLEEMITVSSNAATYALLNLVGTAPVNETMMSLGLTDTEIRWAPFEPLELGDDTRANVTSAADMVLLFRLLLASEVVSPWASAEMLDLLKRQQINDRLPHYLPPDVEVAHKTGNLDGLIHDAGVIYTPAGPMIVTVLTEGIGEASATNIIARIGELAYEYGSE